MRTIIERWQPQRSRGFSLIEVVIATALFATAIVAVIGLMAPVSRSSRDTLDAEVGGRLLESVQRELDRLEFDVVASVLPGEPIFLYATPDGSRVLRGPDPELEEDSTDFAVNRDLLEKDTPGIAQRDRYFLITLRLAAQFDASSSGSLPISARIEWPYRLPGGPSSGTSAPLEDPSIPVEEALRQSFTTFFAMTR